MTENEILQALYTHGLIKTWQRDNPNGWTLVSGLWSPFYIQLRNLPSYPELLTKISIALGKKIKTYGNKLLGIAMAGIPIATAISINNTIPLCYTRKLEGIKSVDQMNKFIKEYGEHRLIEGEINNGDRFIAIDDIVTRFDSKLVAINQLLHHAEANNLSIKCQHVAVVIDREQGAEQLAKSHNIHLHPLLKFKSNLSYLKEMMTQPEYTIISDYLDNPDKYQDKNTRDDILSNISLE